MSLEVVAAVIGLALVCTALAFVLFFELIVEVGPARSTVITYVNPAVAVLLGVAGPGRAVHLGHRARVPAHPRRVVAGHRDPARGHQPAGRRAGVGLRTGRHGGSGGGRSGWMTTTGMRREVWRW